MRDYVEDGMNATEVVVKYKMVRSTHFYHLSHTGHVARSDLEPPTRRIWETHHNGCGRR